MNVTLSPAARAYAVREASYLKVRSQRAAQQFSDDLKRVFQSLQRFPAMGKTNYELPIPDAYRFVMGEYLIDYSISKDQVLVLAIRHGRERPPNIELDEAFDLEEPGPNSPAD